MTPVERLLALEQFGIKLGLDGIRALVAELGRPDRAYPSVLVAGTNGKGSVAAMVERGLRAAGQRTGRYTSPHLDRIEERVALDGTPVSERVFAETTARVLDVVDAAVARGALAAMPTFFEVSTAVAFEIFRQARVGAAVVEVGLGGRFDATNVLTPAVSAIVSIGLDHERHLGHTLAAIAFEKAGVARRGAPLVVGPLPDEAAAVVARVAAETGAIVVDARLDETSAVTLTAGHATLALTTPVRAYPAMRVGLAGRHQADNAGVAVRVLEEWASRVARVPADAIVAGVERCEWPGRLEWLALPGGGRLLVDAAHNPAGAEALAAYLAASGVAPLPIVLAVMADKDLAGIAAPLARIASRLVATTVPRARARRAEDLARELAAVVPGVPIDVEPAPDAAVRRALAGSGRAVAAGSIFLIGPLRARLLAHGAARAD